VVLTNPHPWSETLLGFQAVGVGYAVSGPPAPVTLSSGQSVTLTVSFAPQAAGQSGGRVFVFGPSVNIPLSGTGTTNTPPTVGSLTINPGALNFGSVILGGNSTQTAVLSATGGSVTVMSASSSNGQFALSGANFPITILSGQTAQVNVVFTPQSATTASGNLSFASNATNSPGPEAMSGSGTPPQVSLAWSPSTSQVQGYNVYRGTTPGSYSKINPSLNPTTSYIDTTVSPNTTYYYAATAVSSSGMESGYSAPVTVVVP
jgi:Abnormal spindle-like microcephaly-assoc'd, ASPM-SPD-2-Hydin